MSGSVGWFDRLRIEWAVWSLDQQIYDLPRRSRIEKRRELRQNLLAAATTVGTGQALRNLGPVSRLAREYLAAQFGDRPRPHWMTAGLFLATTLLVVTSWFTEAVLTFGDGIRAADPSATGTYSWDGFPVFQSHATWTFTGGAGTYTGGALTLWAYLALAAATILVGRLWRVIPGRRGDAG